MKKIEEYLYNNGLDWTDIILYILMGVLIALAIVLIGVIVYGIWETVTAKHEYISGEIYCIKEHKSKTDSSLPMKTGDITGFIDIDDKEYISVFRYNGKKIKSDDEDIYKQKKPATSSTKKSKLSKNHANKTTKTETTTTTSTGYKHVVAKDTKTVTKTVVTTTKVYYKKTLTTTVKKQVTVTTTTINYLRRGNPDYMKLMGTVNTQIPTKVGNAMKADGLKVVLNPNLSYDGVYSASRNSIEMKNNVDYGFMHEIGHYVDRKTGYVSGSTEFKNIFNSEKSKYKGFYSDWNLDSGNYARTSTSDYFAECFRDYYFSANSRSKLKANCPKSYSFIQKTINKF